ncbi:Golgi-associated plant pathoproteinsis- protein 1 [Clonorchis sinensis]|uniref:Golgi-associated plant pathoproteinsis- protein 1 n=1 Tax=Clonorchis sinensis TaxID=79923 RepID=A0A8T1MMA2_CLOSI|nr:Golgi-associated plant pathoproteinsis- protein 1 [Clonorchis sinensis]
MPNMDDFIEECLREHNAKRELHGAPALKHSRALDKTAQDWAEALISEPSIKNSPLSSRGEVGESISMRTSSASHVDIQGNEVVNQWYADIKNYNFAEGKGPAGNFTQLVWKATREVGFGKARSSGKCIVVAHYRPPGNVRGHYAENVGTPTGEQAASVASATDTGNLDPNAKRTVVTEEVTSPEGKRYTVHREVIETTEPDGHVRRCVNETFQDSPDQATAGGKHGASSEAAHGENFADAVTRAHNVYRKRHGVADLQLDPEISHMAQDWAEQLVNRAHLSNSGFTYQGVRLGENVLCRWSNTAATVSAQDVVDHWYQESSKYKFTSEPKSIQGIGGFTQVVWNGSQRIGVGIASQAKKDFYNQPSQSKVIVVCFYYPPGNVTGQFRANVKQGMN